MEDILSDTSKFTVIQFTSDNGDLKYILDREQEIKDFLQELVDKGVISIEEKKENGPIK